jgi:hypothetical protein
VQHGARVSSGAGSACVVLGIVVELVDQRLVSVDELVDDLHEGRDGGGP